jgi:RNA polymerase sigma factor (TIGR02999 family)
VFRRSTQPGRTDVKTGVASLIAAAEQGDAPATEELFSLLYAELHRLAKSKMAQHGRAAGLGVTSLLHEAYLDMAARNGLSFPDRARFMGYAARVMRGLIIDHVRQQRAQKRGGRFEFTTLPTDIEDKSLDVGELTRISLALDKLAKVDSSLSEIVDLKYFCGFSFEEIAALQGTTERTAQRRWEKARIYLRRHTRASLSL